MSIYQRLLGRHDTKTAVDLASDILGQFDTDPIAAEAVGLAEQKADGTNVSVDDVVAQMRDESDAFDADLRADILTNLFDVVDEYANSDASTRNSISGELVGFLEAAEHEDLLTANGYENAESAAQAGDIERLQDIIANDPKLREAVGNEPVFDRVAQKLDLGESDLLGEIESDADADTKTDNTMADDTDDKQDGEEGGKMSALDLMEQLDAFDSDKVEAVKQTAEMTGQPAEEVAADIVGDMLDLPTGGSDEPDMNAEEEPDEEPVNPEDEDETDGMADSDGDSTTDSMTENAITEDELDSKLESFREGLIDSVTDAVTSEETVTEIGQKLGESDEAREAIADGLMDDVDEKLESEGMVTPSPTQTADENSGKAADTLLGTGDD